MTTVDRRDISRLQEDLGGLNGPTSFDDPVESPAIHIKPPEGVPMNMTPRATSAPAKEIEIDTPVVVIRFSRGRCVVEDPIGTIVALDDAATPNPESSASEIASLLRTALVSTTKVEFDDDPRDPQKQETKQLTFTETRAISDAIVKWSVELGKP